MADGRGVRFAAAGAFHKELKERADSYFAGDARQGRDVPAMYLKTALILAWFVLSWVFLVFVASSWPEALLGCLSLAGAMAGIGFSVQHDANHGSYASSSRVNAFIGGILDVIGGSSYIWRWKHNVFHHSQPNVVTFDADLDVGVFARLAPEQRWRRLHRYQHFYLWFLYGFLAIKWHFVDDVLDAAKGRVCGRKIPRPQGWKLTQLVLGKLVFFSWAFVIPFVFHPWWHVLLAYALTASVLGVVMAMTFQLAHCVDVAEFPSPPQGASPAFESDWAVHQLRTTVDFAPENRWVTWYLGGLNFQVVHHLFPKVCHLHYPALARIVRETSRAHGLTYRTHRSVWAALTSHGRWLRQMGQPPASKHLLSSASCA